MVCGVHAGKVAEGCEPISLKSILGCHVGSKETDLVDYTF